MMAKSLVKSTGLAKTNRTAMHMAAQFDRAAQLFNEGLARLTADYKERCRRALAEDEPETGSAAPGQPAIIESASPSEATH
jgi:hypothetical protein